MIEAFITYLIDDIREFFADPFTHGAILGCIISGIVRDLYKIYPNSTRLLALLLLLLAGLLIFLQFLEERSQISDEDAVSAMVSEKLNNDQSLHHKPLDQPLPRK